MLGLHFVAMPRVWNAVPAETALSALGQPSWVDRIPDVRASGLTNWEIEPLVTGWQEAKRAKIHVSPFRAAMARLLYFSLRKPRAHEFASRALSIFRPTENVVTQAADRFREYLTALSCVPEARQEQVNKIRKLGSILWVNLGFLDVIWLEFLRAQCVIEVDDLD
ncbi:hypothetical protein BC827DRAFT_1186853 [Russula dissimulans]|nr:hypothetical protein BC827DRAFT_1186853 [Russula dissimulans]